LHWVGKRHTEETKSKMSKNSKRLKTNLGKRFTDEHREKISVANKGNKGRMGIPHSDETKRKQSVAQKGRTLLQEHRENISKSRIGYKVPAEVQKRINTKLLRGLDHPNKKPENREKLRKAYLNRIKNYHGQLSPFYNPSACKLFEEINKELGWSGRHAENGGEINVRGWFLDYYEPTLNIVIEYDEKHHLKESQKQKDELKQKEVIAALNCKFYRITEEQSSDWKQILNF
jgi:hypothetical protein